MTTTNKQTRTAKIANQNHGVKRRVKLLAEPDVDRLIGVTTGERLALRDRALLEVLYATGIRVSELCGLNGEHVDLEGLTVTVFGKGRRWRTVPLTRTAAEALRGYCGWRLRGPTTGGDEPVFLNTRGQRLIPRLCRRIVAKYARKALLPHSSPHTLRHSCASHLLKRGAYLFTVKDLLGHKHQQTTAGYLHRMPTGQTALEDFRKAHPRP